MNWCPGGHQVKKNRVQPNRTHLSSQSGVKLSFSHTHARTRSVSTSMNRTHLPGAWERRRTTHSCCLAELQNICISKEDIVKWLNTAKALWPPTWDGLFHCVHYIFSVFLFRRGFCLTNNTCLSKRKTQSKHKLAFHDFVDDLQADTCVAIMSILPVRLLRARSLQ